MLNETAQHIDRLIRARYSVLHLVTWEEERVRTMLTAIAQAQGKLVFEWSITDGLRRILGPSEDVTPTKRIREPLPLLNEILQADTAAIYVLKDFHTYLDAPEVVRQLRDLADALRRTKKTVVFVSPVLKLPSELEKSVTILDVPLPSFDELSAALNKLLSNASASRRFRVALTPNERDAMVKAAQGLTLAEAENAFALAIVRDNVLDAQAISAVIDEKKQVIRKSGVLEYYEPSVSLPGVGGMGLLKDWLQKRVRAFTEEARRYGLPEPRGILLMGVQGCGKSLVAKTIASAWRMPLLRLDMSRIFEGYIGSSEANMRRAVQLAESLAPVVLWIDEIEKAFAGMEGSGSSDAGTTSRVLGHFLTWIQERSKPVFVVATANEVRGLPPELMRKGRLDEIFFVDLPNAAERAEIVQIHLRKVRRDPATFDIAGIVTAADGFSGAEIEQAIVSALHDSFFAGREVETGDILRAIKETVPLSTSMRERVDELRAWARDRARPVSSLTEPASGRAHG